MRGVRCVVWPPRHNSHLATNAAATVASADATAVTVPAELVHAPLHLLTRGRGPATPPTYLPSEAVKIYMY